MKTLISHIRLPGSTQPIVQADFDITTLQPEDLFCLSHHASLANAVSKRQAEHLAGRLAAQAALHIQGVDAIPGIGADRTPSWPFGFTGSISHTRTTALATVIATSRGNRVGIGLDRERVMNEKTAQETVSLILSESEQQTIKCWNLPFPVALTLIFSAKESLFKALYGHVGHYFDFCAAEIIKIDPLKLELKLIDALGPFCAGQCFQAHWQHEDNFITTLTYFCLPERN